MEFVRGLYGEIEEKHLRPHIDSIERIYQALGQLPHSEDVRFASIAEHERIAKLNDPEQSSAILYFHVYNWLKFFLFTSTYKTKLLLDGLIPAYNAQNYLVWVILGRSSIEYAASFDYFGSKIGKLD